MRQRILTNTSGYVPTWTSGPLDDLNLEVNHADTIGMQVCYWGNFYGDATDTYTDGLNGTDPAGAPQTGLHL
jgi:predicted GNAT superfamily acetyltransferase